MQAQTDQQTVLPSYEQAVRNPTSSEFQSATAPPMNYEGSYPRQTLYPVQAPYPTQQQQLYQATQQQQQRPYPTQPQQSYPTQPQLYPTQQPLYPPQQPPYPTQQQQQQPYPTQPMPNYSAGRVIAPGSATAAGPTIHVIRHVSTGNTGCSGKRGVWLGILLGLLILAGLLRAAYD